MRSQASDWVPGPSPKKGRDLLQYMGAHPRRVGTREDLAQAFWPDVDSETVAHRVHLAASGARSYVRKLLDGFDAIHCARAGYEWHPNIRVTSDVETFLTLCKSGDAASLRVAIETYGGEFLAGEGCDWFQPLRVRCTSAYECALERVAREALSTGDYANALAYGQDLVQVEPGHEGATRIVMRSFVALGQRNRALERYAALCAYLKTHLALEPTEETAFLAGSITEE